MLQLLILFIITVKYVSAYAQCLSKIFNATRLDIICLMVSLLLIDNSILNRDLKIKSVTITIVLMSIKYISDTNVQIQQH